jgi:hypothetical protein
MKKYFPNIFFLLFLSCLLASNIRGQSSEYTLKAVYIEKFTRFIVWPDSSNINNKNLPFVIGTLGKTPFKKSLQNIFSIQKIYDKPVKISEYESVNEIDTCHVLFIASEKKKDIGSIISQLKNMDILTIGDTPGYGKQGVLINFYSKENKLEFEINETAFHQSPLDINFYLLNMGKIVDSLENQKVKK